MNNKEYLKNKIATELISAGKEDFPGEQNIAHNLLNNNSEDIISTPVEIYAIAVKKFLEKRKFEQALEWLEYALVFRKDYYQVYFRKGEVFRLLGEYKKAVKHYTIGINLYNKNKDPNKSVYDLAWGYIERAICYIRLNEYQKANKDLIVAKNKMVATNSKNDLSAGFAYDEISKLAHLSLLSQSNKKIAEELQEIINEKEKLVAFVNIAVQASMENKPSGNEIIDKLNEVFNEATDKNLRENIREAEESFNDKLNKAIKKRRF